MIMDVALRRGFIWPSYEIYGGLSGFYDYGPNGATMKKNIEDVWRRFFCVGEGFLEISSPTIGPEPVFKASGHVDNFIDPMVECEKCSQDFRADHIIEADSEIKTAGMSFGEMDQQIKEKNIKCPECGGSFGNVWNYNLMFKTNIGPGNKQVGYLRPETAQGMFVLFNRLYSHYRKKLPFGVAQIGKSYRNEISPRQGLIRLREFTQAEVEIFIDPDEKTHPRFAKYENELLRLEPQKGQGMELKAREAVSSGIIAHELITYYIVLTKMFLMEVGVPEERIRFRQHLTTEMAHYAADCWDAEIYTDRFGWIETVGIADRTDFDLKAHEKVSKGELRAYKQFNEPVVETKKKLEPNMGRIGPEFKGLAGKIIAFLKDASDETVGNFVKNNELSLEIDGEQVRLTQDHVSFIQVEEKIGGRKFIPHVLEPSFGIDRIFYSVLESSYFEREEKRVLRLKSSVAPVKAAVFPLVNKEELNELGGKIEGELKKRGIVTNFDSSDTIGRRYARVDEIGVPFAITVDFDSLENGTVTLRERDTAKQERIEIGKVAKKICDLIEKNNLEL